ICTRDRTRYFGEIKNGRMIHSPAGAIANVLWYDISRNSDTIDLGEFVIMPDHMHGIIIIAGSRDAVTPSNPH
ncbi:MAG TPA: hypothetical protein VJ911_00185, partial [Cryomorphaceae bacterium]|nr:hypothetical protein [Cryomorphaceae bacterium]